MVKKVIIGFVFVMLAMCIGIFMNMQNVGDTAVYILGFITIITLRYIIKR